MKYEDVLVRARRGSLFARVWGGRERCRTTPPIILFHDSLGSVELWRDFPGRLSAATGCPVVAYDRLGFGRSDPHPGRLEIAFVRNEARSLPALRAALDVDRMILFGHSVGGAMAVVGAVHNSAATVAVITEGAQAFVEDVTIAAIREAKSAFLAPGEVDRLKRYHGEKAPWVLAAWTETWLHPQFATLTLDNYLRRLRCPILAIHGDRDEYGSGAHPQRIARLANSAAEVVVMADCGHVPHREQPDRVLRAVNLFLERCQRK